VELYHHESISRGQENNPEKIKRFNSEVEHMKNKWQSNLKVDTLYNRNLTNINENFGFNFDA